MNPTLLLRIASFLSLLHCALHTVGGVFGSPKHGAEEVAVLETMKAHRFDVMGSMRTYWDFLFGYGLFVTIALLVQAILFWQLSTLAKANPGSARPIVALFFFNCVGGAIVSGKYFFIGPAATQSLIAVCLGLAFVTATAAR
jgi:phosphoglycerol transferase MdoB-like AlkP superfamily enzyme